MNPTGWRGARRWSDVRPSVRHAPCPTSPRWPSPRRPMWWSRELPYLRPSLAESPYLPPSRSGSVLLCGPNRAWSETSIGSSLGRSKAIGRSLSGDKAGVAPRRIYGPNAASSTRLTTGRQLEPAIVRAQPGGRLRGGGTIGSCSSSAAEFSSPALAKASEVQSAASYAGRVARLAQWGLPSLVRSRDDRAWDTSGAK
jgi:hypothetical protein